MGTMDEFEDWAVKKGLSIAKCGWHRDVYESEAALYAYMGWEARQKEIDTLKAKLEEFILCMEGTEVHEKAEKLMNNLN